MSKMSFIISLTLTYFFGQCENVNCSFRVNWKWHWWDTSLSSDWFGLKRKKNDTIRLALKGNGDSVWLSAQVPTTQKFEILELHLKWPKNRQTETSSIPVTGGCAVGKVPTCPDRDPGCVCWPWAGFQLRALGEEQEAGRRVGRGTDALLRSCSSPGTADK